MYRMELQCKPIKIQANSQRTIKIPKKKLKTENRSTYLKYATR